MVELGLQRCFRLFEFGDSALKIRYDLGLILPERFLLSRVPHFFYASHAIVIGCQERAVGDRQRSLRVTKQFSATVFHLEFRIIEKDSEVLLAHGNPGMVPHIPGRLPHVIQPVRCADVGLASGDRMPEIGDC